MSKSAKTIECSLPGYQTDRKEWRKEILSCARKVLRAPNRWSPAGPFEVIALLYLTEGKQYDRHDVDNRLKDILDGLQGAFNDKVDGKRRHPDRLIANDSSVCRVVVEKQYLPKKYKNRERYPDPPGGRLIVRPYTKQRWPFQVTRMVDRAES